MMKEEYEEDREYAEIEETLKKRKPTFSDNVMKYTIARENAEDGLTDADIYNEALFNRDLFCKIKNNREYKTKKNTALAFAVVLHLDADQAEELLESAGYSFSDSIVTDMIVKHFIEKKIYDTQIINDALENFNQRPLFEIRGKLSKYD